MVPARPGEPGCLRSHVTALSCHALTCSSEYLEMDKLPMSGADRRLALRARNDASAWGEIYDRHVDAVFLFVARRVTFPQDAADLASETFLEALVSIERFDPERGSLRAWLIGIARHKVVDHARAGRAASAAYARLGARLPSEITDNTDGLIERLAAADAIGDWQTLLGGLPPKEQDAVRRVVLQDESFASVAASDAVDAGTVRQRVSRGVRRLRNEVEIREP